MRGLMSRDNNGGLSSILPISIPHLTIGMLATTLCLWFLLDASSHCHKMSFLYLSVKMTFDKLQRW